MLRGSSYLVVVRVNKFRNKNLFLCAGFHLVSADYLHPY